MPSQTFPYLGFGLGLRREHYQYILDNKPKVDWFEVITENFLVDGGNPLYYLDNIRENYPIVMHGVSLSIGSTDELKWDYLRQVKQLIERIQPKWVSDHLCWTGINQLNMHDLLPLPYTEEAINHVAERITQVQEFLGRQILLENLSSYVSYIESEMTEWEFLSAIAEKADCLMLLDINNIYVSSYNHQFDPETYMNHIPVERVQQFHLAGHLKLNDHIIDTHDHTIIQEVWDLYAKAVRRFGKVSTMIERDDNIPEFPELYTELSKAREIADKVWREQKDLGQIKLESS